MTFTELGLNDAILRAVIERGYSTPTPIQAQAIPAIIRGGDLLAAAQTGTGKTAGFTLPILHRLASTLPQADVNAPAPVQTPSQQGPQRGRRAGSVRQSRGSRPHIRALILTPTRELAAQVHESVEAYGFNLPLRSTVIFGGVGYQPQIDRLRQGVDILVATPGRLLDHVQQGTLDLRHVEILVLDEADRMLDMGFIRDIKKILTLVPPQRQNLLFSATFTPEIRGLAHELLDNPATIEVAPPNATADRVKQRVIRVDAKRKRELLTHMILQHQWFQVLVFTRTKHLANRLAEQLERDGISAMAIHGNKSQGARTRALSEFKSGQLQVLVATDIAARGLDISELPHVVNYELPQVPEDYVHRIGRTGRAGAEGEAVSLVCVDEDKLLYDIQRLIGKKITAEVVAGYEPDPSIAPQPILQRQGQRRGALGQQTAPRGRGQSNRRDEPTNRFAERVQAAERQQAKLQRDDARRTDRAPDSGYARRAEGDGYAPAPFRGPQGARPAAPNRAPRSQDGQAPAGARHGSSNRHPQDATARPAPSRPTTGRGTASASAGQRHHNSHGSQPPRRANAQQAWLTGAPRRSSGDQ